MGAYRDVSNGLIYSQKAFPGKALFPGNITSSAWKRHFQCPEMSLPRLGNITSKAWKIVFIPRTDPIHDTDSYTYPA